MEYVQSLGVCLCREMTINVPEQSNHRKNVGD